MSDKIVVRRGTFSKFLPDNDTIRQFEKLFSKVDDLISKIWRTDASTPITSDTTLLATSRTALVDCTSGVITVTLPSPSDMVNANGYSLELSISKIDTTGNIVMIQPNNGELICGDSVQKLFFQNEVVNLVTNGTDWYLGA